MPIPKVLVIAGSDSSGGAGLEADQRTLAAHGVYALTATTALTAQNTLGVQDVHITPPAFVEKQIRCVLEDIDVDVVKLGMLASSETITTLTRTLKSFETRKRSTSPSPSPPFKLVVDPVTVSTSGAQLLPGDAVRNLCTTLLPSAYILTPNIPEATLLLRDADIQYRSPSSLDDLKVLAKQVHSLGPRHVLLKGGHMPLLRHSKLKAAVSDPDSDKVVVDILFYRRQSQREEGGEGGEEDHYELYEQPFLSSPDTHGTGCTLASAIAANLATHLSTSTSTSTTSSSSSTIPPSTLHSLIGKAIRYVSHAIATSSSLALGHHGSGPINHLHSLSPPPLFPPGGGHFIPYLLTHPRIAPLWHAYTHHRFPTALAQGTLAPPLFRAYLIQDYHYLKHFARTYALAGYKSQSLASTVRSAAIILHIRREMDLHLAYCRDDFALDQHHIDAVPESPACIAYSRYILDVGLSSDLLALFVALAPCLLGYGQVADRIYREHTTTAAAAAATSSSPSSPYKDTAQGNRYWRWIENYVADDYREAVVTGTKLIEDMVEDMGFRSSPGKIAELVEVFRTATEMEIRFWDEDAHLPSVTAAAAACVDENTHLS